MTKNTTTTNQYRIPADRIQNLEIDRNGRIAPRLHDLEPLENTLLGVLYPGIKVASVNVPTEPLDDFEESQVENALARLIWNGVHYKLVGASGSAKKGKFYFVDQEHSRDIAERFQHSPQAAIVYLGILVSPCKVMMEAPDARVLVVPDRTVRSEQMIAGVGSRNPSSNCYKTNTLRNSWLTRLGGFTGNAMETFERRTLTWTSKKGYRSSNKRNGKRPGRSCPRTASTSFAWPLPVPRQKAHSKLWRMMLPTRWKRTLSCRKARSNQD